MSKNTTRKGLALGAGLGLVASGFVGIAPASAAETLALAPSAGTLYKVLTTTEFELTTGFAGTESAAATATLKYLVTNPSGATMAFDVTAGGSAAGTTTDVITGTTTNAAATATSVVVTDDGTDAIGTRSGLAVSITPVASTSASITVQAFLDIDGSNSITGNEATSPARTIEFTDHASISATATVDTAAVGAGILSAVVTLPGVNMDQLDADDVKVEYFENNVSMYNTLDTANAASGTGFDLYGAITAAQRTNPNTAAWDATEAELRSTFYVDGDETAADTVYTLNANAASSVYSAKVRLYDGSAWVTDANSTGAATPSSGQVSALTTVAPTAGSSNTATTLRAGSGSVTFKTTATVNATYPKAGNTVTFTIEEVGANTLDVGATLTAGGKTLSNSNIATVQKITVDATTDALGVATVTVNYTGLKDPNTIKVKATALNTAAVVTSTSGFVTFTADDSDVFAAADNVYGGTLNTVIGQSFTTTYKIVDQFGQVPVGTYRLVISENGNGNYATTVAFVNGSASFTQVENSTSANAYTLSADVEQQNTDLSWDTTPTAANGALAADTAVNATAAANAPSTITVATNELQDSTPTLATLELDDVYTGDKTLLQGSVAFPTYGNNVDTDANDSIDGVMTHTWTVRGSNGVALSGSPITVSTSAGLILSTDSDNLFGNGSISGTTNSSGQFTVKVYSNMAGKHTFTATAGSATKTATATFAAAKADTATVITLDVPASSAAGTTFKVTAKLTDKYGNPVTTTSTATNYNAGSTTPTFSFTYPGAGLIVGSTPTGTDANGVASFSVLLGSNDSGTQTISVTYDADGTATASAAISASASHTVGTAGNVGALASWTKNLNDGTVKMYAKNIVGAGKVQFMLNGEEIAWVRATSAADSKLRTANGASYLVRTVDLVEGQKNVLEIYVDGVRTTRTAYTY